MRKKLLATIIIFAVVFAVALSILNFDLFEASKQTAFVNGDSTPKENKSDEGVKNQGVSIGEFTYSGWIPNWASDAGLTSLQTNNGYYNEVSPVWYEINEDGSLKNKKPTNASQIQSYSKENDIVLVPTVAMFDHELFSKVLKNQEALDKHVDAIVDEVVSNSYDGIDLDYESTKLEDKEKFFELIEKISSKLHKEDKIFIFTVLAQWDKPSEYSSFKETRQVQDWQRLSKHVDYLRIMAYDYTFGSSPNPGPIAPLWWMEDILDYAVAKVPKEKLILGIHLYSYEWYCDQQDYQQEKCTLDFSPVSFLNVGDSRKTRSYTYETTKDLIGKYGNDLRDHEGEKIYRYSKQNPQTGTMEERMIIYIDPQGVQSRINLAQKYGIKGVTFWRLGGESELIK